MLLLTERRVVVFCAGHGINQKNWRVLTFSGAHSSLDELFLCSYVSYGWKFVLISATSLLLCVILFVLWNQWWMAFLSPNLVILNFSGLFLSLMFNTFPTLLRMNLVLRLFTYARSI